MDHAKNQQTKITLLITKLCTVIRSSTTTFRFVKMTGIYKRIYVYY